MEDGKTNKMLQIGMELQNGKYVVKSILASGGFGNTYIVEDKQFQDKFVLKELFIKGINDRSVDSTQVSVSNNVNQKLFEAQKEKFKKEARRLRHLNNKHIVRVYDLFDENDTAYYVMDYIEGESLSNRLKRTNTPLSEQEAMNILLQVLDALEEVHDIRVWHLDLKPGNILVDKYGNAYLIDFGASKQLGSGEGYETTTNSMCYTSGYAPSEQVDQNIERIGPWTDLYALGATLYNLLTCHRPPTVSEIQEGNAFSYPPNVSEKTKKLIEWMMSPARVNRPQSVSEVKRFLAPSSNPEGVDDECTIVSPKVQPEKPSADVKVVEAPSNVSYEQDTGRNINWSLIFVVGVILIAVLLFVLVPKGNKAQAPIIDTDSIAEVVDSVADSLVCDMCDTVVLYDDNYYSY